MRTFRSFGLVLLLPLMLSPNAAAFAQGVPHDQRSIELPAAGNCSPVDLSKAAEDLGVGLLALAACPADTVQCGATSYCCPKNTPVCCYKNGEYYCAEELRKC